MKQVQDSFEKYLGKKDHISASDIKAFLRSPQYYYHKKYELKNKEGARHFVLGTAIHEAILEPNSKLFAKRYVVSPKFDRRKADDKKASEKFAKKNKNKIILLQEELDTLMKIATNALQNPMLCELIRNSYREVSIYTADKKTGLKIRLRPDSLSKHGSTITDLKTCIDGSPKEFKKDVYSYGYAITSAFYTDFAQAENYFFASLEKQPPHQVSLYALSDEILSFGRENYRLALDGLAFCYEHDVWCDYNEWEILKECIQLGNTNEYFDLIKNASKITLLK